MDIYEHIRSSTCAFWILLSYSMIDDRFSMINVESIVRPMCDLDIISGIWRRIEQLFLYIKHKKHAGYTSNCVKTLCDDGKVKADAISIPARINPGVKYISINIYTISR